MPVKGKSPSPTLQTALMTTKPGLVVQAGKAYQRALKKAWEVTEALLGIWWRWEEREGAARGGPRDPGQ